MSKLNTLFDLYNNPEIFLKLNEIYQNKNQSCLRGNIFEKYAKIIFMFGYYENYELLDENFKVIPTGNTPEEEEIRITYLKTHKVMDSCAEGIFDIKLKDKITNKYLFLSCKYYNKEKTLDHYDILEMAENIKGERTKKIQIGLVIKNKTEFLDRVKYSRNLNIKKNLNLDNVFDYEFLKQLYNKMIKNGNKVDDKLNVFNVSEKNQKIIESLQKDNLITWCIHDKQIDIIQSIILYKHFNNVLIISTSDDYDQVIWKKEDFTKFYEFEFYNVCIIKNDEDLNNFKPEYNNIVVINMELLKEHYKKFKVNFQMIFLDDYTKINNASLFDKLKRVINNNKYDNFVSFMGNIPKDYKIVNKNLNIISYKEFESQWFLNFF